ncbi:ABC transporter permease [Clostridium sp. MSJ-8]|uniref:ABC transporter permease n=1 Tax=Clostridium sp. MSJ-8 TaxID=2841510 RepID=UPI001C0F3A63|nr:ABC transporter permease [Clostridium sp. MSJ-8]MBU5487317.1 ABC transporter permease [Clostridium sp. MSJ-8]
MRKYLWIDLKIMFRIPLSVFFTIGYPLIMMVIIMLSYGNASIGGGYTLIDKYFMIAIGIGILPLTLISFPMWIGNNLESKSMQRLSFFRVKAWKMVIGDILAHLILSLISMAIDIVFAYIVFNLHFPDIKYFLGFLIQYILAVVICMLIGGTFSFLFKNTQILMPFGLVVMFVLYMFCGVFITFDELPITFKNIAKFIPMKYAMNDFFYIWTEEYVWNETFIKLSLIYLIIFSTILLLLIWKYSKKKNFNNEGGIK